jgi:flagellar basal-body rod modification protein FlgD
MPINATSAADTNSIGLQAFLKILTTQLTNQDPLKPMDNQQFIAQLAQFSALEQQRELNGKIDQMLSQQSASLSIGLLGKLVDINTADGGGMTGKISAISFETGTALFTAVQVDANGNPNGGATLFNLTLDKFVRVH